MLLEVKGHRISLRKLLDYFKFLGLGCLIQELYNWLNRLMCLLGAQ